MKLPGIAADTWLTLAAGLAAGLAVLWLVKKAGEARDSAAAAAVDAVKSVADALNPTSASNLAYRGVNALGDAITADDPRPFSLGVWLYEVTHPAQNARDNAIAAPVSSARTGAW